MALEGVAQGNEGLYIAATANDLDDDVEFEAAKYWSCIGRAGERWFVRLVLLDGDFSEGFGNLGVEVDVDATIHYSLLLTPFFLLKILMLPTLDIAGVIGQFGVNVWGVGLRGFAPRITVGGGRLSHLDA